MFTTTLSKDAATTLALLGKSGIPKVKFSHFYYPYPLIGKTISFSGVKLASLKDIAAMKIAAISDRGTKRDFVDLYFLIKKKFPLEKILGFYDQKYNKLSNNIYHITKSLSYFTDADSQDLPRMLIPVSWEEVKKFFHDQSLNLAREKLGL